jgi:hypothetical protein
MELMMKEYRKCISAIMSCGSIEIDIEMVYNMYRVKPASVYGPSHLCLARNLQTRARP